MKFWDDLMARKKLFKSFRAGNIYLTIGTGDNERKIYPKIHHVEVTDQSTEYVFTLPNGMDPKVLTKNEFALKQILGKDIKLNGEIKKFTLTVNHKALPKELTYNYKKILPLIDKFEMPVVCGIDEKRDYMTYNMITEPNCLISGEPGAGKSTQLRSILTTLIQYKSPEELEIYLGDLKMSEFFMFKGIKHVKSVCVYDTDLIKMLKHLQKEMKKRGELLNQYKVTHVNKLPDAAKVPYILLCIDEVVMIMDNKDMKKILVQLVALGRALGMFCILSLQRPSHDILDTKIRGLLTVRMGFRTTDFSNSRIIGTPGSEKISKEIPGRFLIKRDELTELQAPYLTEEKAEKILKGYRDPNWKDAFVGQKSANKGEPKEQEVFKEEDVFEDVNS